MPVNFSFRATASVKSIPLSPLKINDLEGIQPMLIHVPPYIRVDFSTAKTDSPFEANAFAKVLPPFPKPMHNIFDIFPSFSLASFFTYRLVQNMITDNCLFSKSSALFVKRTRQKRSFHVLVWFDFLLFF